MDIVLIVHCRLHAAKNVLPRTASVSFFGLKLSKSWGFENSLIGNFSDVCVFPPLSNLSAIGIRYGKYCGVGWSGCPGEKPCDDLDDCCRLHDDCVEKKGSFLYLFSFLLILECNTIDAIHYFTCSFILSCNWCLRGGMKLMGPRTDLDNGLTHK